MCDPAGMHAQAPISLSKSCLAPVTEQHEQTIELSCLPSSEMIQKRMNAATRLRQSLRSGRRLRSATHCSTSRLPLPAPWTIAAAVRCIYADAARYIMLMLITIQTL